MKATPLYRRFNTGSSHRAQSPPGPSSVGSVRSSACHVSRMRHAAAACSRSSASPPACAGCDVFSSNKTDRAYFINNDPFQFGKRELTCLITVRPDAASKEPSPIRKWSLRYTLSCQSQPTASNRIHEFDEVSGAWRVSIAGQVENHFFAATAIRQDVPTRESPTG